MGKTSRRDHLPERAEVEARAAVLLEALPFIQQFAGATVVVKYGGAAMRTRNCSPAISGTGTCP